MRSLTGKLFFPLAAAAPVLAFAGPYRPVMVRGGSMAPTFRDRQIVLMDRSWYRTHRPRRGDVVVVRRGGETWIKRIYRTEEETVYYTGRARDRIEPLRQATSTHQRLLVSRGRGQLPLVGALRVPRGFVFLLGDNPAHSYDSRDIGPVPLEAIDGRVLTERDSSRCLQAEGSLRPMRPQAWQRWLQKQSPAHRPAGAPK